MINPAIVFMVFLCVVSGCLWAQWDSDKPRRKASTDTIRYFSIMTPSAAAVSWAVQSHTIAHFWWYHITGEQVVPKLAVIRASWTVGLWIQLCLALCMLTLTLIAPVIAGHIVAGRAIAKRRARKAAKEASSNE